MNEPPILLLACISFAMYVLGLFAGRLHCLKKAISGKGQKITGGVVIAAVIVLAVPAIMNQSVFLLSFGVLLTVGFLGLFSGGFVRNADGH